VEGKLKLKVNRDKSAVDRPWNRTFLGFSFLSNRQATIRLAPRTIQPRRMDAQATAHVSVETMEETQDQIA